MADLNQKPPEIRFSVFYEKNSNKDTSLIYKEAKTPDQEALGGVCASPVTVPKAFT